MPSTESARVAQKRRREGFVLAGMCERCGVEKPESGVLKCTTCREDALRRGLEHRNRLREGVLSAYGRSCRCCGEDGEAFLVIDHIEGGGTKQRQEIGSWAFYSWLQKQGYPEGYQTLCHNCNWAKFRYGTCPHRVSVESLTLSQVQELV